MTTEASMMAEFRVTFGQKYRREPHPFYAGAHPDGWLTIVAETPVEARTIARRLLGEAWSGLYPADDPDGEWHLYPLGELAHVKDRLP